MGILEVNHQKCIKCGKCIEVCPTKVIEMGGKGPEMMLAERCIACGHCVAVCPYEAIDNERNPLAQQTPLERYPVISAQTAAAFLRARRSIRCFKKDKVERQVMRDILNIARFAPTASNSQGLSYIVVESAEVLQKVIETTIDWMELQKGTSDPMAVRYQHYVKIFRETGRDIVLRGATGLIVATAKAENFNGRDNARYSLEYAELYATTVGVGTCWAGFSERCATAQYPPMLELLKVSQGAVVAGILMTGIPKYGYKRLPERNPLNVIWI